MTRHLHGTKLWQVLDYLVAQFMPVQMYIIIANVSWHTLRVPICCLAKRLH